VGQFEARLNWDGCGKKGVQQKILGCMLGSVALVCVAGCKPASQLVVVIQ